MSKQVLHIQVNTPIHSAYKIMLVVFLATTCFVATVPHPAAYNGWEHDTENHENEVDHKFTKVFVI